MTVDGTPMTSIREERYRFIRLNEQGKCERSLNALDQLERFGDDLIECIEDGHPVLRHQAIRLLGAARPRSDVAVPVLIERLEDENWRVVTSAIFALGDFGPLASAAIPQIEPWLDSPNEYLRLLAATTIVKLDGSRTEFLPIMRDSTQSDDLVVRDFAREYLFD